MRARSGAREREAKQQRIDTCIEHIIPQKTVVKNNVGKSSGLWRSPAVETAGMLQLQAVLAHSVFITGEAKRQGARRKGGGGGLLPGIVHSP